MTTYISLDLVNIAFPSSGAIRCSTLTSELIKDRMAKVEVVSLVTPGDIARLTSINCGLALPFRAETTPAITRLQPGDELFVVASNPLWARRYRVPVCVDLRAPYGVPQAVFGEIIDHAHAIALWQRGAGWLKDLGTLKREYFEEYSEFKQAWQTWMDSDLQEGSDLHCDVYLEWADMAYKALCVHFAGEPDKGDGLWQHARRQADENIDPVEGLDVMLAKYARRANGEVKDLTVERNLARPLIRRYGTIA